MTYTILSLFGSSERLREEDTPIPQTLRRTRKRQSVVREGDARLDRPSEVEYKCGMFMVLPFYFILVAAKH